MSDAAVSIGSAHWLWQACTSTTVVRCAVAAAVFTLLGGLLARAWVKLHRGGSHRLGPGRQAGTATVEFALVLPILLLLVLALVQTTLLMAANLLVNYAAFAATRAAITQIPADYSGQGGQRGNVINPEGGSPKFDRVKASALFAVMPVSGRLESADVATEAFIGGLEYYFSAYGQRTPRWVKTLAADRLRYAAENTDVSFLVAGVRDEQWVDFRKLFAGEPHRFGPKDPVTARVRHRLHLSVPYVRMFFADGRHTTAVGRGAYTDLTTQYTLTNEGFDPSLPPLPALPRIP